MASKRLCEYHDMLGGTFQGIFHRWGESYFLGERNEEIPLTVAIVESVKTGEVVTLRPDEIKFLPPPSTEEQTAETLRLWTLLGEK